MDISSAKAKLDHVIKIAKVEMYKPIQVAEVLHVARTTGGIDLGNLETYRTKSRHWRDQVTTQLYSKHSTSSARYQDDVWNDNAVPPTAMVALGEENSTDGRVETYIYSFVIGKNKELVSARASIRSLSSIGDVTNLLEMFDAASLRSSAERLYEILATAVFKTELQLTSYTISVDRPRQGNDKLSIDKLVDLVATHPIPLAVDRLGHTNAADAGLDIWTNFGVAVNVKRRALTVQLLRQVVKDTPIGALHIVCLDVDASALSLLEELRSSGLSISITTKLDLMNSVARLLASPEASHKFLNTLTDSFDREFPMARTLGEFVISRGYDTASLSGRWSPPTISR